MTYPGNPSLALDVQRRIVETFLHTLDTAESGSLEEAKLGCDFVLRLDPLFAPAQALSDRLGEASGPLDVADLRQRVEAPQQEPQPPAEPARPSAPTAPHMAPPSPTSPGLTSELSELMEERKLEELLTRAQSEPASVTTDPSLVALVEKARELLEAAPYIDSFLEQARAALAAGRAEEVEALLNKVKALDGGHPAIGQLQRALAESAPDAGAGAVLEPPGNLGEGLDLDLPDLDLEALPELPFVEAESPGAEVGGMGLAEPPVAAVEPAAEPQPAPSASGPSDPDPRIAELLDEGQAAFERGEFQSAVDAWSRIFLIDIDHAEAARRIDLARDRRAEKERQAEEGYHDALSQAEAGDVEAAKASLQQVLGLQGGHAGAKDALDRLERGEAVAPSPDLGLEGGIQATGQEELKEEILVPPDPDDSSPLPVATTAAQGGRTFRLVGASVLVLAAAVGGYLFLNRETWFPNSEPAAMPAQAALPTPEQTPITRARQQYEEGQRTLAIARLKRVPPASPYYLEAQALVGQWEAEEEERAAAAGPSAEELARRTELLEHARRAATERRFLEVRSFTARAADIAPLEPAEEQLLQQATSEL
jgi:tetratricopeptide (TPR) repeat protein